MTIAYLTDEEIIKNANFYPPALFLVSNQTKLRIDTVKGILASGCNVAIVYWDDGVKAYIPLDKDEHIPSEATLIKAYRTFHAILNDNTNQRGHVWIEV